MRWNARMCLFNLDTQRGRWSSVLIMTLSISIGSSLSYILFSFITFMYHLFNFHYLLHSSLSSFLTDPFLHHSFPSFPPSLSYFTVAFISSLLPFVSFSLSSSLQSSSPPVPLIFSFSISYVFNKFLSRYCFTLSFFCPFFSFPLTLTSLLPSSISTV